MEGENRYEKPQKLSELLEKDEKKFALKVMAMVEENHKEFETYRDKCWRNERVWRNRHWDESLKRNEEDLTKAKPNAPTLFSTVENMVADIVDNIPGQAIRGVNYDDDMQALIATELVRFTLQRAKFPKMFERKARRSVKQGVGTLQAYWNPDVANGMGDIDFRLLPIDDITWDKSVENINDGQFFATDFWLTPKAVYETYPDIDLNEAMPDDENKKETHVGETEDIRRSKKEDLVRVTQFTWKEKEPRKVTTKDEKGKENTQQLGHRTYISTAVVIGRIVAESHIRQYEYDRFFTGMLPHIEIDGEPIGLSAIDIFQDDADVINFIEQQYICNLQASAREKFLVNRSASIDEKALTDNSKLIIRGNQIHEGAVRPFRPVPFTSQALNYRNGKMAEVKEQSGQTDFNIGQTAGGVTSGYGIERMQAYGQKISRLTTRHYYWDHQDTVKDVLKLAQKHYKTERVIRISREAQDQIEDLIKKAMENLQAAVEQGIKIDNKAVLKEVMPEGVTYTGKELKVDFNKFSLDYIDLDYDIEIIPQKQNAATSAAMNEFVMMMVNSQLIDGETAIELWEQEGKEKVIKKIRKNNDTNKKLQAVSQQAQEAAEQAQAAGQLVEQLAKENEKLKQEVWVEKFKNLEQKMTAQSSSEEGVTPETAEEAKGLIDEILGGIEGRNSA